jgi:hypothetical protein
LYWRSSTDAGLVIVNVYEDKSARVVGAIPSDRRFGDKGVVIAKSVDELHGANNLTKQTALSEKGSPTKRRGDTGSTTQS